MLPVPERDLARLRYTWEKGSPYPMPCRRDVSSGIAATFSSVRSSQRMRAGCRGPWPGRQSMTRSGVTMKSTGTSWLVSGIVPGGRTCGGAGRARDRGRLARRLGQVVGIQGEERLRLGQPGNGHVHGLSVLQRALANRQLGGVRVGLDRAGRLPGRRGGQASRRGLGAGEVGDAAFGAGEPGHLRRAHRGPDLLPQQGLGGKHIGGAAGVTIMTGNGSGHAPILPSPRRAVAGGRHVPRLPRT
jgi:hypothetical protein